MEHVTGNAKEKVNGKWKKGNKIKINVSSQVKGRTVRITYWLAVTVPCKAHAPNPLTAPDSMNQLKKNVKVVCSRLKNNQRYTTEWDKPCQKNISYSITEPENPVSAAFSPVPFSWHMPHTHSTTKMTHLTLSLFLTGRYKQVFVHLLIYKSTF